jgi:hypothetical protein
MGVGDLLAEHALLAGVEIAAGGAVVAHLALGIDQNLAAIAAELDPYRRSGNELV